MMKKNRINKPFYTSPKELIWAISNDLIPEFKPIRNDYLEYIRCRLGYSKEFVEKATMNYQKKNYKDVKTTNKF